MFRFSGIRLKRSRLRICATLWPRGVGSPMAASRIAATPAVLVGREGAVPGITSGLMNRLLALGRHPNVDATDVLEEFSDLRGQEWINRLTPTEWQAAL